MAVIDRHCKGSMDGDGDDDGSLAITEYRHRVVTVCLSAVVVSVADSKDPSGGTFRYTTIRLLLAVVSRGVDENLVLFPDEQTSSIPTPRFHAMPCYCGAAASADWADK